MERLTMIDGIGNDELVRCMGCGLEKAGENLENCGFCEEGWQKALKKLAAYEDTGLDPEDLKKTFNEELLLTMTAQMMGITPERLRELVEADRDGRCVVQEYKPGDPVWVVERDEIEAPDCVSGYVFVAHANGAALVSAYLGDCGDVDAILADCIEETRETGECDIEVFPIEDCYHSIEDAESALKGENHEADSV